VISTDDPFIKALMANLGAAEFRCKALIVDDEVEIVKTKKRKVEEAGKDTARK
jgi:hypothetical protein